MTRIPTAADIGATHSPKLAFEVAEVIAQELQAVGVNLNFCPVLDIATNPDNPVIGDRSFGADAQTVCKMGSAMLRGHFRNRVQPCAKHFPGHGDTHTDSHFALPRIDTPMDTLHQRELLPFIKAIQSKCTMIMTAHIIVSSMDSTRPATLSKTILQGLLREQLHYDQIIVSDDMEMKAITDHFGAREAPRLAIEAGCNLLIYRSEPATRIAYDALVKDLTDGLLPAELVLASAQLVRRVKEKILLPYQPISLADLEKNLNLHAHQKIVDRVKPPVKS
jgi:beta-N-acetylhexosaminidase